MHKKVALVSVFIVAIIFTVLFISGNQNNNQGTSLGGNPEQYVGKDISLSGDIEEKHGAYAFTLDAPGVFGEKVLVISRQPIEPIGGGGTENLADSQRVSIEGQVQKMDIKEIEKTMGIILNKENFKDWEGRPVIVAESIEEQ